MILEADVHCRVIRRTIDRKKSYDGKENDRKERGIIEMLRFENIGTLELRSIPAELLAAKGAVGECVSQMREGELK